MSTPSIPAVAVTGATGHIGGQVARLLADEGVAQRLIVRDAGRAPTLAGAEVRAATYGDAAAMRTALDGIETVFLISATESPDRVDQHRTAVDAAIDAGVQRIVYLSFFGADPDAVFTFARDHWHTEEHIRQAGCAFTFLQDNLYADFLPGMEGEDGVIRGPAGDGRFAPVAQRDVAAVAARVLLDGVGALLDGAGTARDAPGLTPHTTDSEHDGATYRLTGPELLSMNDVAERLSSATGRDVRFHDETEEESFASRAHYGAADWKVQAWVSTYQAIAAGELAPVTGDVAAVIGRAATSLDELLRQA